METCSLEGDGHDVDGQRHARQPEYVGTSAGVSTMVGMLQYGSGTSSSGVSETHVYGQHVRCECSGQLEHR